MGKDSCCCCCFFYERGATSASSFSLSFGKATSVGSLSLLSQPVAPFP